MERHHSLGSLLAGRRRQSLVAAAAAETAQAVDSTVADLVEDAVVDCNPVAVAVAAVLRIYAHSPGPFDHASQTPKHPEKFQEASRFGSEQTDRKPWSGWPQDVAAAACWMTASVVEGCYSFQWHRLRQNPQKEQGSLP